MRRTPAAESLVLLDRDGVINEDSAEYIKSVEEWRPIRGSLEAIAALHAAGFRVVVVTNQSGVGRGLLSEETLAAIHAHMAQAVEAAGGALSGIYYCPHRPEDGCGCRKPRTGLLRAIARDFACSLEGVPFIGDKPSDVQAARAVGARPILVQADETTLPAELAEAPVEVYRDLAAAAHVLLGEAAEEPRR